MLNSSETDDAELAALNAQGSSPSSADDRELMILNGQTPPSDSNELFKGIARGVDNTIAGVKALPTMAKSLINEAADNFGKSKPFDTNSIAKGGQDYLDELKRIQAQYPAAATAGRAGLSRVRPG